MMHFLPNLHLGSHHYSKKYVRARITEPISITCVITKSESERWKSFHTVIHVDLNLKQVFEARTVKYRDC